MVMLKSSQNISKGGAWKGVLLMLLLTLISVLSFTVFETSVSFVFLPLIGVCLWPRTESIVFSIVSILLFGLLLDILSAGPLGLWALVFLSVFAVVRPHMRLRPHVFQSALLQWIAVLTLAVIASYLLGWFALESRPDHGPLLYQAIAALVLFPVVYGLRHLGKHLIADPDMRGL